MKKILIAFVLPLVLFGCGTPSFEEKVAEKIEQNVASIAVNELTDFEWNSLYVLHPYETRKVDGQKIEQIDDAACTWVFTDASEKLIKKIAINRSVVDCLGLQMQPFKKHEALFLVNEGKLKMRKIFKLNR